MVAIAAPGEGPLRYEEAQKPSTERGSTGQKEGDKFAQLCRADSAATSLRPAFKAPVTSWRIFCYRELPFPPPPPAPHMARRVQSAFVLVNRDWCPWKCDSCKTGATTFQTVLCRLCDNWTIIIVFFFFFIFGIYNSHRIISYVYVQLHPRK